MNKSHIILTLSIIGVAVFSSLVTMKIIDDRKTATVDQPRQSEVIASEQPTLEINEEEKVLSEIITERPETKSPAPEPKPTPLATNTSAQETTQATVPSQTTQPPIQETSTTPTNNTAETPTTVTYKLSDFKEVQFLDYAKNPKLYLNKPIKLIGGEVVSFNQNSSNYIGTVSVTDFSSDPQDIAIRISDDNNYSKFVEEVQKWDNIIVYGFGRDQQEFTITGTTPYKEYVPVVESYSIYFCKSEKCRYPYDNGAHEVF